MFLRSGYNYDVDEASVASGLECKDDTLAQQHFKDEADINRIVKQFVATGMVNATTRQALDPQVFYDVMDYQSALEAVRAADEVFMQLPAELRERFDNDAGAFVDFVSDPVNASEIRALGLGKLPPLEVASPGPEGTAQ
jgi:phage internal scaffolding protein